MTLQVTALRRIFRYNGAKLADPQPTLTPDQVRQFYAATFPELATAIVEGPSTTEREQVFEFRRSVGTKGRR